MKKSLLFSFSLFLMLPLLKAQVNTQDSLALVAIYNSTSGSGWTNNSGWLQVSPSRVPVSEWEGVLLSGDRVNSLNLSGGNLNGTIPANALSDLSALQVLDLSNNPSLSGSLPATFSNSLTIIDFSGCNFSGTIPAGLAGISDLNIINISGNSFSGTLPTFTGASLYEINGSDNQLVSPFPSFPASMVFLYLSKNQFSGSLPTTITNLSLLERLSLDTNNISGSIPSAIQNLTELAALDLTSNNLSSSIPSQLTTLSNLASLRIGYNGLTGAIPSGFDNINGLSVLAFNNNQLSGAIPSDLCGNTFSLLHLQNNQFDFDGMECLESGTSVADLAYDNQRTLAIQQNSNTLSVDAGGTIANNTYQWSRNNTPITPATTGNASLAITQTGTYTVEVTNSVATGLTLFSSELVVTTLPLDWLSIKVSNCTDNACLEWTTENEVNTATFEVEKSVDGVHYQQLGTLAAANRFGKHTYHYTDEAAAYGINYYRVRQTDLDGKYSYSQVVSLKITASNKINIVPNPASGFLKLKGVERAETITITNVTGQPLLQWRGVQANQHLDISTLQSGLYIIKVKTANGERVFKIIKQ